MSIEFWNYFHVKIIPRVDNFVGQLYCLFMSERDEWISVTEAAKRTGYTARWIQYLAREGKIESKPFGVRVIQVNWLSIEKFYQEHPPRRRMDAPREED